MSNTHLHFLGKYQYKTSNNKFLTVLSQYFYNEDIVLSEEVVTILYRDLPVGLMKFFTVPSNFVLIR